MNTDFYTVYFRLLIYTLLLVFPPSEALASTRVTIAAAANFTAVMREIAKDFETQSGYKTRVSFGSTGKLYTQILHQAPFDVFLAADRERPRLLHEQGLADAPFTYAVGKLVLWSSDAAREVSEAALKRGDFNKIALANPKTAPYGAAALDVMKQLGLSEQLKTKQVYGENIAQTYQFTATGNTDLGFIALAQIRLQDTGSVWEIPQNLYEPIQQDAVLLKKGRDNPAAQALFEYLQSPAAREIIVRHGYAVK